MDITKKLNWENLFIFLFLVIFPFGQIIRIGILQPIDIVVGLAAVTAVIKKYKRPEFFNYFENFLFVAAFSWLLSVFIFRQIEIFYGLLYLARLAAYFYFFVYVWNFAKKKIANKELLLNSLLGVSTASAIFGWIQYFRFPDIKPLFTWGWDEHLFRLVGTFLDPTYLGLIIVFGSIIAIYKKKWFLTLFLIISLAFTYSRASYLALLAGILTIGYGLRSFRKAIYLILGLILLVAILPTSANRVLVVTRLFSAVARVENYSQTLRIFAKSPVFGVGYDNLCLARNKFIAPESFLSHSCSGSDSSLLFILATTGIIGFIVFVWIFLGSLLYTKYNILYTSSLVALLVHSLFSNSLFYSWIMGYLLILLAVNTPNLRGE